MTIQELGAQTKKKYPQYADKSDEEVGNLVAQKYPEYQSQVTQPQEQESGGFNPINLVIRALNIPSNILGGATKAGADNIKGEYQAPQIGGNFKLGKNENFNIGQLIAPPIVGAVRGIRDNQTVMEELPTAVGVDPNSAAGMGIGFAGEIATPDLADALAVLKLGKGAYKKLAGKAVEAVGGKTAQVGEDLVLKGLRPSPSQITKFEKETKEKLPKFLADRNITGNFKETAQTLIDTTQDKFDEIALQNNVFGNKADLLAKYDEEIKTFSSGVKGARQSSLKVADELKKARELIDKSFGDQVPLSELTNFRREIGGELPGNEFVKAILGDKIRTPTKEYFLVNEFIQEAADKAKTGAGKELKNLGQELKKLIKFKEIADKQSGLGKGSLPVGLLKTIGLSGAAGAVGASASDNPVESGLMTALLSLGVPALANNPKVIGKTSQALQGTGNSISQSDLLKFLTQIVLRGGKEAALVGGEEITR